MVDYAEAKEDPRPKKSGLKQVFGGILKFLIADDHHLIREGLKHTLQSTYDDLVLFEAKDGEEVLEIVEENPDLALILLDFFMPGTNGFGLISTLCDKYPDIPVVVISASDDVSLMRRTLDRGVAGFIPKATDQEVILRALQLVLSGGVYIPRDLVGPSGSAGYREDAELWLERPLSPTAAQEILNRLTQRQVEVLELIAQGKTNKDISRQLTVSENTVKVHVTAILKSLGVNNRTQAVVVAQKLGLPR